MTDPTDRRREAEQKVVLARQQLTGTVVELRDRLDPRTVAQDMTEKARRAGTAALKRGATAVKQRPVTVAATAGLMAGILMIRTFSRRRSKRRSRNRG